MARKRPIYKYFYKKYPVMKGLIEAINENWLPVLEFLKVEFICK